MPEETKPCSETRIQWVDTHCHLDMDKLKGRLDEVLSRARERGVTRLVTIGCATSPDNTAVSADLAAEHADIMRATVGVHPHDASSLDPGLKDSLADVATRSEVVAVGELGLDYYYEHSPRPAQQEAFRWQLQLARSLGKPVVVHTRDAAEDTLRILREENVRDVGGVIHCFSENRDFAQRAVDLNLHCSFSGICTFKRSEAIRDAATHVPGDRLLVETDAPFLAPIPHRGKTNEPAFVVHTAQVLAELRGVSLAALAEQTTRNARDLFKLP